MLRIRRATPADAPAAAAIHVASWQHAYRGHLPDAVIARHTVASRTAAWTAWLTTPTTPQHRHHVLEVAGVVTGFAVTGPSRDDDARPDTFELFAIYLDPAHIGRGAGAALLGAALGEAAAQGARAVTLWVLDSNTRARGFYERVGFARDGREKVDAALGDARELRYRLALA